MYLNFIRVYWSAYSNKELLTPIINVIENYHYANIKSKFKQYAATENEFIDTLKSILTQIKPDDTLNTVRKEFTKFVSDVHNISGIAMKQRWMQRQLDVVVMFLESTE